MSLDLPKRLVKKPPIKNLPNHNYKKLDNRFPVTYKTDRIKEANDLGYDYISEATIKLYRQYKSQAIVAKILKMSPNGVGQRLSKYGEPMRGPGSLPARTYELKSKSRG